jgi:phosphatidylinositol-3-phosphatase
VMALLSFGVLVGSLVNSAAGSPAGPELIVVGSASAGETTSSSDSGQTANSPETTTITTAAPSEASPQQSGAASTARTTTSTTGTTPSSPASSPTGSTLPPIKHVFVIMLSDNGYQQGFSQQSPGNYLAMTLRRRGELIQNYYGVAGGSLANEIGLVSGQGPTAQTTQDCPTFDTVAPGTIGAHKQIIGNGCVYPTATGTLPAQLTAAHHTWRAYIQSMGDGPPGSQQVCRHPSLGGTDPDQTPRIGDPYVTWSNPFVYFRWLIDNRSCTKDDVGLPRLASDLRAKSRTPSFAYIVPDVCHDGGNQPCAPGAPAGLAATNSFLHSVVPEIERSPAYKASGLLAITFDEAPQTGPFADSSACCATPTYPNVPAAGAPAPAGATTTTEPTTTPTATTPATTTTTPSTTSATAPTSTTMTTTTTTNTIATAPTTTTTTSPVTTTTTTPVSSQGPTTATGGGGQVGLLLISRYVKPDSLDAIDYFNHFSLLASIEHLFKLPLLGYAKSKLLSVFGSSVYNAYKPS